MEWQTRTLASFLVMTSAASYTDNGRHQALQMAMDISMFPREGKEEKDTEGRRALSPDYEYVEVRGEQVAIRVNREETLGSLIRGIQR